LKCPLPQGVSNGADFALTRVRASARNTPLGLGDVDGGQPGALLALRRSSCCKAAGGGDPSPVAFFVSRQFGGLWRPFRRGRGKRVPSGGKAPQRGRSGRHRVDGDALCGSGIIDTIGPPQADEPLSVAFAKGHGNTAAPQGVNAFADLVREAVGRQALRTGRVDLFQQRLGRGADLLLLPQQRGEERQDASVRFAGLFTLVRQQIPDVSFAVELQRQLPVGDVSAGAVEGGGVLPPLALAEHEVGVRSTAETSGAGDHVHGIIVAQLAQVMDQQHGDAVPVRQTLEHADVPVVVGVGTHVIAHGADALQRVDDHEPGGRMLLEELLDLLHQPAVELLRHDGEVQRGRCVLGEIEEPALDALEAVLQTEVEDLARVRGKIPEGFAPRHPETQPQRQPGLSDLRRAGQQVQSLGQQILHKEGERLVGNGLQGVGVYGVEFFHQKSPFEISKSEDCPPSILAPLLVLWRLF